MVRHGGCEIIESEKLSTLSNQNLHVLPATSPFTKNDCVLSLPLNSKGVFVCVCACVREGGREVSSQPNCSSRKLCIRKPVIAHSTKEQPGENDVICPESLEIYPALDLHLPSIDKKGILYVP